MFAFYASLGLAVTGALVSAGPCDIYRAGGTPCVAAHSTTRALFDSLNGIIYQVTRNSDLKTADIKTLSAGGVADAAQQDQFCQGTTCFISIIYDQTGKENHLQPAPPGGAARGPRGGGYDNPANANAAPITLGGHKAYGVYVTEGIGYRRDNTRGVATGDAPEGMYAVLDGSHSNSGCCFDYGNAETNNKDDGPGTMEAIYFGSCRIWGTGFGTGPWIMADLEDNLFSGGKIGYNPETPTINHRFVTAWVKGEANHYAIRGGNGNGGNLDTYYSGARPAGYNPMKKQGAIVLGIGGDNSISAVGTFYEGCMTQGYPSDATEAQVQANIVAQRYAA